MSERRKRFLRTFIAMTVLVLGATFGGLYIHWAATEDGETAQAEASAEAPDPGDEQAEATEGSDEETAIPVNVTEVASGSISTYLSSAANLVPEDEVQVLAEAEGRVTRLLVEEGDVVERGQLLAALLQDEAAIAVNKARLTADNADMAHRRAQQMHAEQLISQEDFDRITMDHRIAQQELAEAEWKFEKTEIRAPIDGRVTLRNSTLGQHVRPGDELFTVTDFSPLIARIYLPERDVLALAEGRTVGITLRADDTVRFDGRIRRISPVVDTATGTVKVTIAAVDPPRGVRPGGFVTIDITRETREDTLLLPREAVVRELKKAHVFVAKEDTAEKRAVTLGLEEGERIEIVTGLEFGDRVVVAGQGGLEDGSKIKVLPEPTEAQASNLNTAGDRAARG